MKLILDFDSTFSKTEALDELAEISLAGRADKDEVLEEIKKITALGMEGKITFPESCCRRFALLGAGKNHVEKLMPALKQSVSESIKANKDFFLSRKGDIYILSGGPREFIAPVVEPFGIEDENILANDLVFDEVGNILGFDEKNPLSGEGGKIKIIEQSFSPKERDSLIMIGDGWTDYEVRQAGLVNKFIAFCENVERQAVVEKADLRVDNFDEVIDFLEDLG